jgi:hypothetical protein
MAVPSTEEAGAIDVSETLVAGGSSISTTLGTEVAKRKIRSTKTHNLPGKRVVKEYPITEDVLNNIGTLRASAAFWAAVGSLALGFALSAWMSLSLAGSGVDAATTAAWRAYRNLSGVFALFSYAAATFYFFKGKSVIQYVKDSTTHDPMD